MFEFWLFSWLNYLSVNVSIACPHLLSTGQSIRGEVFSPICRSFTLLWKQGTVNKRPDGYWGISWRQKVYLTNSTPPAHVCSRMEQEWSAIWLILHFQFLYATISLILFLFDIAHIVDTSYSIPWYSLIPHIVYHV